MVVDHIDLDAAVAAGVISRGQAARLEDFVLDRGAGEESPIDFSQGTQDEPFRLLRGFRDFFIAIGAGIFSVGLSAIVITMIGETDATPTGSFRVEDGSVWSVLIGAGLVVAGFLQAEIITRRMRLPLASLVVAVALAAWSAFLMAMLSVLVTDLALPSGAGAPGTADVIAQWAALGGAILAAGFFYWRYRLPAGLFVLAGLLVGLSFLVARDTMGPGWVAERMRLIVALWGLVLFAAAMWFDAKDRLRVTRISENAFWLHLFASPLLVHALLFGSALEAPKLGFILGTMALLSVVALLIDRRALLVAGLGYLAVAVSLIVSSSDVLADRQFAATAFILGAVMLALGLGWTRARQGLLAVLPSEGLKARLPPAVA